MDHSTPFFEMLSPEIRDNVMPDYTGDVVYECIACGETYHLDQFLYTCPACASLLRLLDRNFESLRKIDGKTWQKIFDARKTVQTDSLRGIFLFKEILFPAIPLNDIVYLGEGHTPMVRANRALCAEVGMDFMIKYDGLNPSASFKDRGMASAVSFINYLINKQNLKEVLGICASTGDTSAAAALYLSYLDHDIVRSVVLLPEGRVTPQQLSQPLASGASVIEIPGVFDDCMKIVEALAEGYEVCLLNSKNPVRIMGQKSYSYEVAQQLGYRTGDLVVVVPVGNAGNVTAIMEGFLDLYRLAIIDTLPRILAVQSTHANPVTRWRETGAYIPQNVRASVAQAAMIGDPVSFPKVSKLVSEYFDHCFMAVDVTEQEIIEGMLLTNRHGHVVCTQGGEGVAGLKKAVDRGLIDTNSTVVVDSTSHQLKFSNFQEMYFNEGFSDDYEIKPKSQFINSPQKVDASARSVAAFLNLKQRG